MTTALVTGASTGIGAVYADRLAARGHDLVLVARDTGRLDALAARLAAEHGVKTQVITADLTDPAQLAGVQDRLRGGSPVDLLINNAGATLSDGFDGVDGARLEWLIRLNVTAPTLLAHAVIPGMLARGAGAIVNLSSVIGLAPEISTGIYGATKAYMLTFSHALTAEFGEKGIYVQAVLPAATRTEIWERSGRDVNQIPGVMEVDDLVDAALVGFDRREAVTIPPLPDAASWEAFEAARHAMLPGFRNSTPAARYRV
ncbi:short-chain dehydrogenase/reductase SDR [Ancylobacter novellus DSM 506]|uniref:Short-chain dehydrogenase/reductase SDR n=1 Tax=Ancylobacter novellus (strain ATCC 8093 / DSM 506 / JCM 20403 / CCM 1077 / IAM 12100 / NBRC 12443 / NCIMB 10456) TaxID=639283 RepID=D7A5M5_ANCN5|nr:SDR family oxidoreductase [Ancylobacter novellus]ADH88149.1 short-chain dehydrogenase/reductase SDR [Ancylobacter novellus DSM 506]